MASMPKRTGMRIRRSIMGTEYPPGPCRRGARRGRGHKIHGSPAAGPEERDRGEGCLASHFTPRIRINEGGRSNQLKGALGMRCTLRVLTARRNRHRGSSIIPSTKVFSWATITSGSYSITCSREILSNAISVSGVALIDIPPSGKADDLRVIGLITIGAQPVPSFRHNRRISGLLRELPPSDDQWLSGCVRRNH